MASGSNVAQQSAAKGFAVLTISTILAKLLSILYVPVLIQILGKVGIGIYSSAYTIFSFIYILANAGIPVAISKMVSELIALDNYKDALKIFRLARTMVVVLGAVISILMLIVALPLAKLVNSTEAVIAIRALAPAIFITTILSAYKGYFQGRGNMTPTAVSLVAEQIFNLIFSLTFAYLLFPLGDSYGAAGGTVGTTVGAIVAAIYLIYVFEKEKKFHIPKSKSEAHVKRISSKKLLKMILAYAVPITIGVGLQNAGMLMDIWIVKSRLLFSGFDQSKVEILWGVLYQYNTLISVPMAVIGSLATSILPIVARHNAVEDKKTLKFSINSIFRVTYIISVPCAFGLAVLSKPILTLIGYDTDASVLFAYGVIVLILSAIALIQTSILQGVGKVKQITVYSVIGLVGKIIINYLLVAIPAINILGAVIGNGVSFLIIVILNQVLINKSLKIKIKLIKPSIKPIGASIVMSIATYFTYKVVNYSLSFILSGYLLNAIATMIAIMVAVICYLLILILIGGIKKSDLSAMPRKILKLIPERVIEKLK